MYPTSEKKTSEYFSCERCDYYTMRKENFTRHLSTLKHEWIHLDTSTSECPKNVQRRSFVCECGRSYKYSQGLSKHRQKCPFMSNPEDLNKIILNVVKDLVTQNNSLISHTNSVVKDLILQNAELSTKILDISKTSTSNMMINSNNKTFNLNVFLNETCKDAMNISEFVESLQLQLADLEDVGKLGFVEGISNIIVKNLQAMDIRKRPVHCTDKKREVVYVKDKNKWEKENEEKQLLRRAIKDVAFKNEKLLKKYKENHPGCNYSDSRFSEQYSKLVIESLNGDTAKEDKIIRRIVKEVAIKKDS
jgi:hypothetical protein